MATDKWTQLGCNIHFKCYAGYLSMGNTLKRVTIQADTIRRYLDKAAKYVQSQRDAVLTYGPDDSAPLDPRQHHQVPYTGTLKMAAGIDEVLAEVAHWTKMTEKQDPVTISMVQDMLSVTAMLPAYHRLTALTDWVLVGIYLGLRKSEYLQDCGVSQLHRIAKNKRDLLPKAFILSDIICYAEGGRRLTHAQALADENLVVLVKYRWRFQKNQKNGEQKSLVCSVRNPQRCPVRATLRILRRHIEASLPDDFPLGVSFRSLQTSLATVELLNASSMEAFLQASACRVFDLVPGSQEAKKFHCHAIRIGAAVALHANNASELQIKFSLRWKSDTFWDYLRDVPLTAAAANRLVDLRDAFATNPDLIPEI